MNHGLKRTQYLTGDQAQMLLDGALISVCSNKPLNVHLTIHCEQAGVRPGGEHRFVGAVLKFAGGWLRSKTWEPLRYEYIFENEKDAGLHAHTLMDVPRNLRSGFKALQHEWVERAAGRTGIADEVIQLDPLYYEADGISERFMTYGLRGVLVGYLLKGLDPHDCARFNVNHMDQGEILGKRCGVSRSLANIQFGPNSPEAEIAAKLCGWGYELGKPWP